MNIGLIEEYSESNQNWFLFDHYYDNFNFNQCNVDNDQVLILTQQILSHWLISEFYVLYAFHSGLNQNIQWDPLKSDVHLYYPQKIPKNVIGLWLNSDF